MRAVVRIASSADQSNHAARSSQGAIAAVIIFFHPRGETTIVAFSGVIANVLKNHDTRLQAEWLKDLTATSAFATKGLLRVAQAKVLRDYLETLFTELPDALRLHTLSA
jgi:hypothetical protein